MTIAIERANRLQKENDTLRQQLVETKAENESLKKDRDRFSERLTDQTSDYYTLGQQLAEANKEIDLLNDRIIYMGMELSGGNELQPALDEANERAEKAERKLAKYLGKPWPRHDVLAKLADAADILLHQKDYDGHGWELIQEAMNEARQALNPPTADSEKGASSMSDKYSLEQCRQCFWQETPQCPRKDWARDEEIECGSFLEIESDE